MPRSPVYSKSEIAIEYAYRLKESAPDIWVFWVHASNAARFEQAYRDIAAKVDLPGRDDPKMDILRLLLNWLCDERNGRWLMNLVGKTASVAQVEPMKEKDALMLLKTRVSVSESLEAEARRLVQTLKRITFAVTHAGAYMAVRERITISVYLGSSLLYPQESNLSIFRVQRQSILVEVLHIASEASALVRWGCDLGYGGPAIWVTVPG